MAIAARLEQRLGGRNYGRVMARLVTTKHPAIKDRQACSRVVAG